MRLQVLFVLKRTREVERSDTSADAERLAVRVSVDVLAHVFDCLSHLHIRKPASVLHRALHVPLGNKVVKYAKHFLGVRYVYGGSSPRSGFDCSGFVRYVYAHFGVGLAHSSFAQFRDGVRVARGALKPGDLVFFHGVGHVGIYIGGGRFIHAPHTGTRVQIASLGGSYSGDYDGARRILRASA